MKQLLHLICLLVSFTLFSQSLSQGDIAFVGINTDTPEGFSIITLKDIPSAEPIYFTDRGIVNASTWNTSIEGAFLFTAPVNGGIACGTVVTFTETAPNIISITLDGSPTYVLQEG